MPDESYFDHYCEEMYKKYGEENQRVVEYETASLSYKTPIMADTLNAKGAFSTGFLQAAFDAYKKLKSKHENHSQDLDELLGI